MLRCASTDTLFVLSKQRESVVAREWKFLGKLLENDYLLQYNRTKGI